MNDCCGEVKSRRAVSSSSATITFAPTIAYGVCNCSDGWNRARYTSSAGSSASGAKCDANA